MTTEGRTFNPYSLPEQPSEVEEAFLLNKPTHPGFCEAYITNHTSDRGYNAKSQKAWYMIDPYRKKKKVKLNRYPAESMNGRLKRKLLLHKVPNDGSIRYTDMLGLHHIWKEYMKDTLTLGGTKAVNMTSIYCKEALLRADYHGAMVRVSRSKCPTYINTEGVIIQETKGTFKIITSKNQVKCIPKKGSVFTTMIEEHRVDIIGSNFMYRPADRVKQKFKSAVTLDL